ESVVANQNGLGSRGGTGASAAGQARRAGGQTTLAPGWTEISRGQLPFAARGNRPGFSRRGLSGIRRGQSPFFGGLDTPGRRRQCPQTATAVAGRARLPRLAETPAGQDSLRHRGGASGRGRG